jgi:uncharacterized protein
MALSLLGVASFASWFLSMLAGAGSPLILIPLVHWLCGSAAVAPILTLGMLLGNGQRVFMFWPRIDWQLTRWYMPGALAGAVLGAYLLSLIELGWLPWVIAIALIAMAIHHWLGHGDDSLAPGSPAPGSPGDQPIHGPGFERVDHRPWQLPRWAFMPLAFFNAIGSALIGSTGPILNPLYLNYGLVKEDMIATKAFHNSILHIFKLLAYCYFGSLSPNHLSYGLVIGAAALPGNWLGQEVLKRMSQEQFKRAAFAFVGFSGVVMLWRQAALVM